MDRREGGVDPARETIEARGLLKRLERLAAVLGRIHRHQHALEFGDRDRVEVGPMRHHLARDVDRAGDDHEPVVALLAVQLEEIGAGDARGDLAAVDPEHGVDVIHAKT
jgi:hypothetical protein